MALEANILFIKLHLRTSKQFKCPRISIPKTRDFHIIQWYVMECDIEKNVIQICILYSYKAKESCHYYIINETRVQWANQETVPRHM